MKVTRTLQANAPDGLLCICKTMGFVRADIWRRFGALGCIGKNADAIRKAITADNFYGALAADGTIRAETTKDVVNDILTYKAAALVKVRRAERPAQKTSLSLLLAACVSSGLQRPPFPTISSGRTQASNCSPVRCPEASAASRNVLPSLCAFFAIKAALS